MARGLFRVLFKSRVPTSTTPESRLPGGFSCNFSFFYFFCLSPVAIFPFLYPTFIPLIQFNVQRRRNTTTFYIACTSSTFCYLVKIPDSLHFFPTTSLFNLENRFIHTLCLSRDGNGKLCKFNAAAKSHSTCYFFFLLFIFSDGARLPVSGDDVCATSRETKLGYIGKCQTRVQEESKSFLAETHTEIPIWSWNACAWLRLNGVLIKCRWGNVIQNIRIELTLRFTVYAWFIIDTFNIWLELWWCSISW